MKIPFIAATALFTYNNKPELGTELLNKAAAALQKYIDSGSWREVKLLVRFLGCLQPLFEGDGIFTLLEELFARAVDLQTASSEDVSLLASWNLTIMFVLTLFCWYSCLAWSLSKLSSSPFPT